MKMRSGLMATALIALVSFAIAGPAGAAPNAEPSAQLVGKVKINKDGTGTVKARYICSGENWHLWVSAKQNEAGTVDPAVNQPGSGFGDNPTNYKVATWLQSHPTEDEFRCDGTWHTQKFEINKDEAIPPQFGGGTIGQGELVPGDAWVQFCLIQGEEGQAPTAFLIDEGWKKVN